jgi:RNA polymerase sigma factor (sigma-70 family)
MAEHGDESHEDFDILYHKCHATMRDWARRRGIAASEIDDVTQDAWRIVHQKLSSLESKDKPEPWLWVILNNAIRSHERRHARRSRRHLALAIHTQAAGQDSRAEAHAGDLALTIRDYERVIDTLEPDLRDQILMAIHGWTYKERAKKLSINPHTANTRLKKARALLREHFDNPRSASQHSSGHPSVCPRGVYHSCSGSSLSRVRAATHIKALCDLDEVDRARWVSRNYGRVVQIRRSSSATIVTAGDES